MRPFAPLLALSLVACGTLPDHPYQDRPQWISHRGRSAVAPENTLPAMEAALALRPAPGFVEIDVHLSADGHLAVLHDGSLERTTDGRGRVAELSWEQIRRADAGFADRFGEAFAGTRVPDLDQVLDLVLGSGTGVMIEVKAHGAGGPAAERVRQRGEQGCHVLASFHPDVLVASTLAAPTLPTLLLVEDPGPEHLELARRLGVEILGVGHGSVDAELVRAAHEGGLKLWVWTVDDPQRAAQLLALGADGIISNDPSRTRGAARGTAR